MAASTYDIAAEQGTNYAATLTYANSSGTAINITGYSARMQVRRSAGSSSAVLTLTNASGITLGGAAGTVAIAIPAAALAVVAAGNYVYDLELVSGAGVVTKLISGDFIVTGEVTR
ncbi:MAG: hypothetical protein EBR47_07405 [Betaproteobacteria bacterium]|nr:hypothetical protein [Betaproteobacteria bacterium]